MGERKLAPVKAMKAVVTACEEAIKTMVEPAKQSGRSKEPSASGGQLDRKRETIKPGADRGDRGCILRRQDKIGIYVLRAFRKQCHRFGGSDRRIVSIGWKPQCGYGKFLLPIQMKR